MRSNQDVEALLRAAAPEPSRPVSPKFTSRVIRRLALSESSVASTIPMKLHAFFKMKLAPLTVGLAACLCVVTAGTVYAALNGWPNIAALFSGETHEGDGARVVKVGTTNCTSLYVPLAFQYTYRQQGGEANYYFRIKKESRLTNEEVVRMVRGNCELGQQVAFDQTVVLPELSKIASNKDVQIFGLFVSSTVETITKNTITVKTDIPTNNTAVKQVRFSFNAIDPDVLVYNIDHKVSLQDIHVGDNVAIKYRALPSRSPQELTPYNVSTDDKTVIAITKNPPNIVAALDYQKYKDDLIEVTPCTTTASGYCTVEEFYHQH